MRRPADGSLLPNERRILATLVDAYPSWTTTGDLHRQVRQQWGGHTINEVTVYRTLARFAARGWLDAKWWVPDDPWSKDRPARLVVLTAAGREAVVARGEAA